MGAPRWSPHVSFGLAAVSAQFPYGGLGWFLSPSEKWLILAEREGFTPLSMLMIYRALINCLNIDTHKNINKVNVRLHRWRLPMTKSHGFFATTLPFSHT
jgi:hypothetical protein